MKIFILTGHFYPEIHPRAFRASELAKEFSRKGHDVNVCILRTINGFDYENYEKVNNIKIQHINIYSQPIYKIIKKKSRSNLFFKINRFLIEYLFAGSLFYNSIRIKNRIFFPNDIDLVISLSTPFMNHLAIAIKKRKSNHKTIYVADSGDPFYRSQQTKRAPYFFYIEKCIYKKFDYLSIPMHEAKDAYRSLIHNEKIKIIPQGFDIDKIKISKNVENEFIKFAYAGVFYSDIRNPKFLFEFLTKINIPFQFEIYLRYEENEINKLLNKYLLILGDKLKVHYAIDREELLFRLSKCDFLINIENKTTTQLPSKLIDYAITKRPIFSCNALNFNPNVFNMFLTKNYSNSLEIDLEKYNIKCIAEEFISLVK